MEAWSNFFLGELGAAAALAGLLFVSVSVNQERILSLGRMADRGLEALGLLFLVLVVVSLPLVPGQPLRLLGAEILGVATITLPGAGPLHLVMAVSTAGHYEVTLGALVGQWPEAKGLVANLVNTLVSRITSTSSLSA